MNLITSELNSIATKINHALAGMIEMMAKLNRITAEMIEILAESWRALTLRLALKTRAGYGYGYGSGKQSIAAMWTAGVGGGAWTGVQQVSGNEDEAREDHERQGGSQLDLLTPVAPSTRPPQPAQAWGGDGKDLLAVQAGGALWASGGGERVVGGSGGVHGAEGVWQLLQHAPAPPAAAGMHQELTQQQQPSSAQYQYGLRPFCPPKPRVLVLSLGERPRARQHPPFSALPMSLFTEVHLRQGRGRFRTGRRTCGTRPSCRQRRSLPVLRFNIQILLVVAVGKRLHFMPSCLPSRSPRPPSPTPRHVPCRRSWQMAFDFFVWWQITF